ncbi:beta strand repeat-containing protein [Candidatus Babela massiliensis]|nr:immunoglobulin domain-containing protein [Candidatus Babela massiliensis]
MKKVFFYMLFLFININNILYAACTEGVLINPNNISSGGTSPFSVVYSPIMSSGQLFAGVCNLGNVGGSDNGNITLYNVSTTNGNFTNSASTISSGINPISMSYSPLDPYNNAYAAIANYSDSTVYVYTMDSSGTYSSNHLTLNLANNLSSVAFSPFISNKVFLAVTEYSSAQILIYSLTANSSGLPTATQTGSASTVAQSNLVTFSQLNNNQLFAAVAGPEYIYVYQIDTTTGAVSTTSTQNLSSITMTSVAFSTMPNGTLFLAASGYNSSDSGLVYMYTVSSSGLLSPVTGSPFTSNIPENAYSVSFSPVTPDGSVFAVVTGLSNTSSTPNIFMFKVDTSSGAFTLIDTYFVEGYIQNSAFSPLTTQDKLFLAVTGFQAVGDQGFVEGYTVQLNPVVTINPNPASTCTGTNLTLQGSVTGGTGNYSSYVWTQGTTQVGTGLSYTITDATQSSAGTYTLTVTDSNNCVGSQSIDVSVTYIQSITASPSSTVCAGTNVQLSAQVSGGSGNYSYSWSGPNGYTYTGNPAIIDDISTSGTYDLIVTDNEFICSTASTISITVDPNPVVTISSNPVTACYGGGTILTANVSGGSGSYSYAWTLNGSYVGTDSSTLTVNDIIPGTNDGSYQVTVTDTTTTCNATSSSFTIPIDQVSVTLNSSSTVICQGASITLTANVTSGVSPYTYDWYQDGSLLVTTSDNVYTINNLDAGTYTYQVIVTDSNPCQGTSNSVSITVNSNPTVTITPNPASVCLGSDITLTATASGGSGSYNSYSWVTPTGTSTANPLVISNATSADAGTYTVTVTDSNICSGTSSSVTLTVNNNPTVTITPNPASVCVGSNLTLTAIPLGGSGIYTTYAWTFNGMPIGTNSSTLTIDDATNDNAGTYQVTVTDSNGCQASSTTILTVDTVNVSVSPSTTTVCSGSDLTLTATVTSGIAPYTYQWIGPNGYSFTGNPATRSNISSLDAGTYTVIVTDANSCTGMATSQLIVDTVIVTALPDIDSVCLGSTITLTANVSGGTAPYSYSWAGPNGFASTVNPVIIPNATFDDAGSYTVTVIDANGCSGTDESIVNLGSLTVNVLPDSDSVCIGSTITLTANVSGGTAPYSYSWAGPNGFTSTVNPVIIPNATLSDTGTYQVTVTDFNSCTGLGSAVINVGSLTVNVLSNQDPVCSGSTITLTANASGGTMPYTYSWILPNGSMEKNNPLIIPNASLSNAGTYQVMVTDFNGCIASSSITLTVNDSLSVNITPNPAIVSLGENITLTANVSGGSSEYISYQWIFNGNIVSTSSTLNINNANLEDSGIYQFTVVDSNNCSSTTSVNLTVSDTLTVIISPSSAALCSGNNLILTADVSGGSENYSYQWLAPNGNIYTSNPLVISGVTLSDSGTYRVTVTDSNANKVSVNAEVTVNEVNVIVTSLNANNLTESLGSATICSGSTITLTADVTSGIAPYTYLWTGPNEFTSNTQSISIMNAQAENSGTYTVKVTSCDSTGNVCCSAQSTFNVTVSDILVSISPSTLAVCTGSTINLTANVSSGVAPYTYLWTGPNGFSSNDQSISIDNASDINIGTYQVTVTDSHGCKGSDSAQVTLEAVKIIITPTPAVVAPGSSITLRADIVCGQGPLTYQWTGPNGFTSNNQVITINNASILNSGIYTLIVTDANGNKSTEEVEVVIDNLSVDIISNTLNVREGQTITLTAETKDGQAPYTYQWFGPAVTRSTSGQLISTDQTLVINNATILNSGTYRVVVTDVYGFTASDTVDVNVRVSSTLSNAIASKYCS